MPVVAVLMTALSGCLPFGSPSEPKELYPADSVSRQIAVGLTPVRLELVYRIAPDEPTFFGSMQLGPDSLIWIGDLSSSSIRRFSLGGEEHTPVTWPELQYPYLAGTTGDTSYVYDVGSERLYRIDGRRIAAHWTLPARAGGAHLSRFVSVLDGRAYVKDAGSGERATLAVFQLGQTPVRVELPGPSWKYHGIVRDWADRVVGTSSFRPLLYFFDESAGIDSMALRGFDSPMLARSRAFAMGDVSDPPLMISSISTNKGRVFVINVRPGKLRIDEYDAAGMLQQVYERVPPEADPFTPTDLLSLPSEDGGIVFFVVSTMADYEAISLDYRSRLDKLSWSPVSGLGSQITAPDSSAEAIP